MTNLPHDPDTGEVLEPLTDHQEVQENSHHTLSERASAIITPPPYWRRVEAIMGEGGPQYELAFFNAQCEIDAIIEADKANPHFRSKYASLAGFLARVRPVLQKHRLTIKQYPGRIHRMGVDGTKQLFMPCMTTLTHVDSGQGESFIWEMPIEKSSPQALASLSTFARRYAIAGIFGIATVDDDAAAATIRNKIENEQTTDLLETLIEQIKATKSLKDLKDWRKKNDEGFEILSEDKMDKLKAAYEKHRSDLADVVETQDPPPAEAKPKARGTKPD